MNFSENSTNYEFTDEQNASISKLARMMLIVSILFMISGGLTALASLSPLSIIGLLQGAALLVIGYSLFTASNSFKKIVETTGNDIANLMAAVQQLYNACSIQLYSIAGVIVLAVLVSLFGQ